MSGTLFGVTKSLTYMPMKEIPDVWKSRLRELSFGPYSGTMWRWTYHTGNTHAALLFEGTVQDTQNLVAWACVTFDEDAHPVVGTYVDPAYRQRGYASEIAAFLLRMRNIPGGTSVFAVAKYWGAWPEILRKFNLLHVEWE